MTAEQRTAPLLKAKEIITSDRNATYGEPEDNFLAIKRLWDLWDELCPKDKFPPTFDVSMKMVLFKLGRIATGARGVMDNYTDAIGYLGIAWEQEQGQPKPGRVERLATMLGISVTEVKAMQAELVAEQTADNVMAKIMAQPLGPEHEWIDAGNTPESWAAWQEEARRQREEALRAARQKIEEMPRGAQSD